MKKYATYNTPETKTPRQPISSKLMFAVKIEPVKRRLIGVDGWAREKKLESMEEKILENMNFSASFTLL